MSEFSSNGVVFVRYKIYCWKTFGLVDIVAYWYGCKFYQYLLTCTVFFCCVHLLLILYFVGNCNLFSQYFNQIISATCGVAGSACKLISRKTFLLLWDHFYYKWDKTKWFIFCAVVVFFSGPVSSILTCGCNLLLLVS